MSRPAQVAFTRLEEIAGAVHVVSDAAEIAAHEVCSVLPAVIARPADAAEIAEILRFAATEKLAVIPTGGCTKLGIGLPPVRYDIALDLSRMNRVLAYDPQDLTLGVEPGVRIEDLLRTLAEEKQFLPLEVPFSERATIGGIVATNSSSPLRHAYGAARDFCLGMEFVTGEGSQAKSGGRVVKNVTGYDLHKLLIGSLGTLAVITRVNFRTFPMPPAQGMFVASFSSAEPAFGFCSAISHSALTPQIVEVADPAAGRLIFSAEAAARMMPTQWSVFISAAGQQAVVERYARELGHMAETANASEFLPINDAEQPSVFARIREFPRLVLEAAPDAAIFRIGVLPTAMPSLLKALTEAAKHDDAGVAALTRASGIVFAAFFKQGGMDAAHAINTNVIKEIFQICARPENGAQAMLESCPKKWKTSADVVWGPPRPDFELMRRVKHSFDPQNVLAPGRFAGGI
jgi:glycolate oxidase FAD binding subunit